MRCSVLVRVNELEHVHRARPPRPRLRRDERASQRHVVPTSAAHILLLSKTSSSRASRVTTGFARLAPRSPMECPVSRRAHPASAGASSCGRALSSRFSRTRSTVPLTSRRLPGHPGLFRPFLRLDRARFHRASVFDARLVPSKDAFHRQVLSERERARTRVTRCRLESRTPSALHTPGHSPFGMHPRARRSRSSATLLSKTSPSLLHQASPTGFCSLSRPAATSAESMRPSSSLSNDRSGARLRRDRPRRAPSNEGASFYPAEPRTPTTRAPFVTHTHDLHDGEHREDRPCMGRGPFVRAALREEDATSRNRVPSPIDPRARALPERAASPPTRGLPREHCSSS